MLYFAPDPAFKGALCADSTEEQQELFFAPGGAAHAAKRICTPEDGAECPSKAACLKLALDHEVPGESRYGVYGGLTATERKRLYG